MERKIPQDRYSSERAKDMANKGYDATAEDFRHFSLFPQKRLDKMDLRDYTQYNPSLPFSKFEPINPNNFDNYVKRPVTVFDIETDDLGVPITISATKMQMNVKTGKFEIADVFQRYYRHNSRNLEESIQVHGLTPQMLGKLRHQQIKATGHRYSRTYNAREEQALRQFMGSSILAGHNIMNFDIPHLFTKRDDGTYVYNQVIDTLTASENLFGMARGTHNDLETVYQKFFGKTMAQAGLPHHDSMSDTVATAQILNKMMRLNYGVHDPVHLGESLRTILKTPGVSLGRIDKMLNGPQMLVKGGMNEVLMTGPEGLQYYMTQSEFDKVEAELKAKQARTDKSINAEINKLVDIETAPTSSVGGGWTPMQSAEFMAQLEKSVNALAQAAAATKSGALDINGISAALGIQNRAAQLRNLASVEPLDMAEAAAAMHVPTVDDQDRMILAAKSMQRERFRKSQYTELRGYMRAGLGDAPFVQDLYDDLRLNWSEWGGRTEQIENDRAFAINNRLQKIDLAEIRGKLSPRQADKLRQTAEGADFDVRFTTATERKRKGDEKYRDAQQTQLEEIWRNRKIDKELRHGNIDEAQAAQLRYTKSNDELVDSLDEVILKNKELQQVYASIGSIKPYDFSKWRDAVGAQANGVFGSMKGVVPNFIRNPMSRMFQAGLNSYDAQLAPIRSGAQAALSILGPLVGGLAGGPTGAMAGLGIGNALGQVVGAVGEGVINKKGFSLQSQFNSLGAIISWVSTPFKLLGSLAKSLAGSFVGLNLHMKRFMNEGIDNMSKMGNPLTALTGVSLGDYQNLSMLDRAAMLTGGTMNGVVENFAQQQRDFYTLGKINTERLIAASSLGVFDQVYSSNPNVEKDEQYFDMVNSIYGRGLTPEVMGWASKIDSALPTILQTMDTLGVSDVRDLTNPARQGMYWNPLSSEERKDFQWTQYRFGVVGQGMANSKMRFANQLWKTFGEDISAGLGKAMDLAAQGDFHGAFDSVKDLFSKLKDTAVDIWNSFKDAIGWDDDTSFKEIFKDKVWEPLYTSAKPYVDKGVEKIREIVGSVVTVWDEVVDLVARKVAVLVEYLSTIHVDWKKLFKGEDGGITFAGQGTFNSTDNLSMNGANALHPNSGNFVTAVYDENGNISRYVPAPGAKANAGNQFKTVRDYVNNMQNYMGGLYWKTPSGNYIRMDNNTLSQVEKAYYGYSVEGRSEDTMKAWWSLMSDVGLTPEENAALAGRLQTSNGLLNTINQINSVSTGIATDIIEHSAPGDMLHGGNSNDVNVNISIKATDSKGMTTEQKEQFRQDMNRMIVKPVLDIQLDNSTISASFGR